MKTLRPLCALQTAGPRRNRAVGIGTGVGANRGQLAARYRRNALSGPGAANRNRVAAESATELHGTVISLTAFARCLQSLITGFAAFQVFDPFASRSVAVGELVGLDRKSTRLNSSH